MCRFLVVIAFAAAVFGAGLDADLLAAIRNTNARKVAQLLQAGANPEATDKNGRRAMAIVPVSHSDAPAIVSLLLNAGAKPTPSALALLAGRGMQVELAKALAAYGRADHLATDESRARQSAVSMALVSAATAAQPAALKMLLDAGGDAGFCPSESNVWFEADVMKAQSVCGLTPLMAATLRGNAEIVRMLINAKADVNQVSLWKKSDDSDFPENFIQAAEAGNRVRFLPDQVVITYYESGKTVILRGSFARPWVRRAPPLLLAIARQDREVVELLRAAGARADLRDESGWAAEQVRMEVAAAPASVTFFRPSRANGRLAHMDVICDGYLLGTVNNNRYFVTQFREGAHWCATAFRHYFVGYVPQGRVGLHIQSGQNYYLKLMIVGSAPEVSSEGEAREAIRKGMKPVEPGTFQDGWGYLSRGPLPVENR